VRKISRNTFNVTAFFSFFAAGLQALASEGQKNWLPTLALFAVILTLLVVYLITLWVGQARSQRELNKMLALDQSDHVRRPPIVLFLRSFEAAKAGLFQRIFLMLLTWIFSVEGGEETAYKSFSEEELDEAIGDHCLFVAIGDKYASYGSAKILVEDADGSRHFIRWSVLQH